MVNFSFRSWLETLHDMKPAVLVATGAYNPIHRGHIKVFYHAKRYLLNNDYEVIAAYLIPRNYDYIRLKSQQSGEAPVSDEHRQAMIQQAVSGTFIKVLPLEANRTNIPQNTIRSEIEQMHPGAEVIFVAGDDKDTCPDQKDTCLMDNPKFGKVVIVGRRLAGDASSTQVRKNIRNTGDEMTLLSPANRKYIQQHKLWGAKNTPSSS